MHVINVVEASEDRLDFPFFLLLDLAVVLLFPEQWITMKQTRFFFFFFFQVT